MHRPWYVWLIEGAQVLSDSSQASIFYCFLKALVMAFFSSHVMKRCSNGFLTNKTYGTWSPTKIDLNSKKYFEKAKLCLTA